MNAVDALITRASAVKLGEPGPSQAQLETVFRAAARAPDHGRLRPWKFLVIAGEARKRLGLVMAEALRRRDGGAPEAALERERQKALRAPLVLVVAAKVHPDTAKIPEIEQVVSAGAAAQNIMLALHALGFGCMWRTGPMAYDASVKQAFGLDPRDHIVAVIYVGTPLASTPEDTRPDPRAFVEVWEG